MIFRHKSFEHCLFKSWIRLLLRKYNVILWTDGNLLFLFSHLYILKRRLSEDNLLCSLFTCIRKPLYYCTMYFKTNSMRVSEWMNLTHVTITANNFSDRAINENLNDPPPVVFLFRQTLLDPSWIFKCGASAFPLCYTVVTYYLAVF